MSSNAEIMQINVYFAPDVILKVIPIYDFLDCQSVNPFFQEWKELFLSNDFIKKTWNQTI